jgi:adenosylcobinamide-phosphate synthase
MGDPRRGHPVAGFGAIAAGLEWLAWRPSRVAGVAYTAGLVGGATTAALWADQRVRDRPFARLLLLTVVTWSALGGGRWRWPAGP